MFYAKLHLVVTEMNYYYLLHYDTRHIDSDAMRLKKNCVIKKSYLCFTCTLARCKSFLHTCVCIILGTLKITLMKDETTSFMEWFV